MLHPPLLQLSIWLQPHDRPWATSALPSFPQIPDPSKTMRGFWIYKTDDQIRSREEFIELVGPTSMTPWTRERICLVFFLPRFYAYIIPKVKWSMEECKSWLCLQHTNGQLHSEVMSWFFITSLKEGKCLKYTPHSDLGMWVMGCVLCFLWYRHREFRHKHFC